MIYYTYLDGTIKNKAELYDSLLSVFKNNVFYSGAYHKQIFSDFFESYS
jgi:hypothetical protein